MHYKIRVSTGGSKEHLYNTFSLTLPANMAVPILEKDENIRFEPELVEEGILYRIVQEPEPRRAPSWLEEN